MGFNNINFKKLIQMKKETKQQNRTDTQMGYDTVLPVVNDDCDEEWYEDEEDYYYQCMCCSKAQSKFNGGSCYLCAGPVQKITF